MQLFSRSAEWKQNKRLAASISWKNTCTSYGRVTRLAISKFLHLYGILQPAVQPGWNLLLNNLNIVDPEIFWYLLSTLYFLDSWGFQQSKERIITGAGLAQPGKSYRHDWTGEFNCLHRSSIEKFSLTIKIRDFSYLCNIFLKFLVALCRFGGSWCISNLFDRGVPKYFFIKLFKIPDLSFEL